VLLSTHCWWIQNCNHLVYYTKLYNSYANVQIKSIVVCKEMMTNLKTIHNPSEEMG
jgi:hypothetical protein